MSNVVNSVSIIATLESKLEIIANFTIPFNNQSRNITYDNTVSGLEATNVEAALDEIALTRHNALTYSAKAFGNVRKGKVAQFQASQGDHILAKEAVQSEVNAFPQLVMGIVEEDALNGEFFKIRAFGELSSVDTGDFEQGDLLWYDSGGLDPGSLTNVEPQGGLAKILIAVVEKKETAGPANNGKLLIRITFEPKLEELQGVAINNPQYKQVLTVNEEGIWVNAPPPSSINTSTEEPPDPSVGDVWFEIT
jgi:hypothetical protein